MLAAPPPMPSLFRPVVTAYFAPVPHRPELRAYELSAGCLNSACVRRGIFGFRHWYDQCTSAQAERVLRHVEDALRLRGLG